jgi:hypothetical protein
MHFIRDFAALVAALARGAADHIVPVTAPQLWRAMQRLHMSARLRKFIGAIALLVLVTVWALLGMALAQSALTSTNGLLAGIYYVVVGLGWVLPAMPIITWMQKA